MWKGQAPSLPAGRTLPGPSRQFLSCHRPAIHTHAKVFPFFSSPFSLPTKPGITEALAKLPDQPLLRDYPSKAQCSPHWVTPLRSVGRGGLCPLPPTPYPSPARNVYGSAARPVSSGGGPGARGPGRGGQLGRWPSARNQEPSLRLWGSPRQGTPRCDCGLPFGAGKWEETADVEGIDICTIHTISFFEIWKHSAYSLFVIFSPLFIPGK